MCFKWNCLGNENQSLKNQTSSSKAPTGIMTSENVTGTESQTTKWQGIHAHVVLGARVLKAVAFCAHSLISKALMVIQRNTLRTPGGTRIRPAIPDGVIFQYKCTRKALTILGILRCGQSILRGDLMRSAICCYYYFSLERKTRTSDFYIFVYLSYVL